MEYKESKERSSFMNKEAQELLKVIVSEEWNMDISGGFYSELY